MWSSGQYKSQVLIRFEPAARYSLSTSVIGICEHPHASDRSGRAEMGRQMTPEDYRRLTPLIYSHVNPYGRFDLDLNSRIDFERAAA